MLSLFIQNPVRKCRKKSYIQFRVKLQLQKSTKLGDLRYFNSNRFFPFTSKGLNMRFVSLFLAMSARPVGPDRTPKDCQIHFADVFDRSYQLSWRLPDSLYGIVG